MVDLAYCKCCKRSATKYEALAMLRCPRCGGTDYIVPGITADDLCQYYVNRGTWAKAKAALLASDLEPWELNERHGDLMTMQECAAWVEREDQKVAGSNPVTSTSKKPEIIEISRLFLLPV